MSVSSFDFPRTRIRFDNLECFAGTSFKALFRKTKTVRVNIATHWKMAPNFNCILITSVDLSNM